MAGGGIPLTFVGLNGNQFYFDDCPQDEVDTDVFERPKTLQNLMIRCPDNKFLILNEAKQFDRKDLNIEQQSCTDYKLCIKIYRDTTRDIGSHDSSVTGRAVMLYACKDNRMYAAVCTDEEKVCAEEVQEQDRIEDNKHKAVFYMIQHEQENRFKLRSSLYPNKALGFDESDSNKLILRNYDPEGPQDTLTINF